MCDDQKVLDFIYLIILIFVTYSQKNFNYDKFHISETCIFLPYIFPEHIQKYSKVFKRKKKGGSVTFYCIIFLNYNDLIATDFAQNVPLHGKKRKKNENAKNTFL